MYDVAAFYRFVPLIDIPALRERLTAAQEHIDGLCGTILLAPEGINGTIGAKQGSLDAMIDLLDRECGIRLGELKYSDSSKKPFNRYKVRPKKEIITMNRPEADPNKQVGKYVEPEEWNALIADPETVLIDTRNTYETKVGVFENALDPRLETFGQFPEWVEKNLEGARRKKIAMYCTGGIRCEKASAYMLAQGFEDVYHLKGGILKYLETIPADQSLWKGECFVFDKRVAVGHGLKESAFKVCYACRSPLSPSEASDLSFEEGVSCPHCAAGLTKERAAVLRRRHAQLLEKS